jgi:hypothetical protein
MGQVAVLLFKSGWNLISIPSNIYLILNYSLNIIQKGVKHIKLKTHVFHCILLYLWIKYGDTHHSFFFFSFYMEV